MDLQSVIDNLLPLLPQALIIMLAVIGLSYGAYALYRQRGGRRTASVSPFIGIALLLGWLAVVMALTTFSRGAHFEGWANFRLFSGYVSAWHQWSLSEWQLILFNVLMFAPLGFLLPLLGGRTRRFVPVLLVSLLVTLGIELFQTLTHRGIFELDDLFHNTLGSVAGYFLMSAIMECTERRKLAVKPILRALSIPLAFALLYAGAMAVYHAKELGNLSIRPAIAQDMRQVDVTLNAVLPTDAEPVALYRSSQIHNRAYGEAIASLIERTFDLRRQGGIRIEGLNRVWTFVDADRNAYTFNYAVHDGGWWLYMESDENVSMEQDQLASHREEHERWMLASGVLPPNTEFSTQGGDTIRWDIERPTADIARGDSDYWEGMVIIQPSKGQRMPLEVFYSLHANKYVRKIAVISPTQAYEEILSGDFYLFNDLVKGDRLQVDGYELDYTFDSKGYYQPVYRFMGSVNGEPWEASVPAAAS
jgi:glycopeptide antibiotics resistance protein